MAGTIASNPIMYGIQQAAQLLEETVGGVQLPDILAVGSGVLLNTSVADIMRTANLSAAILVSMGSLVQGISGTVSGSTLLSRMGIGKGINQVTRGNGVFAKATAGTDTSFSGYVGNSNADDIKGASRAAADDTRKSTMEKAVASDDTDTTNAVIDEHIVNIYRLLQEVISGENAFNVVLKNGCLASVGLDDTA